jgi:hypothetical protein
MVKRARAVEKIAPYVLCHTETGRSAFCEYLKDLKKVVNTLPSERKPKPGTEEQ